MGLGNLRDKLLQAGLVSEEAAEEARLRAETEAKRETRARDRNRKGRPARRGRRGPQGRADPAAEGLTEEELAASARRREERAAAEERTRERNENRKRAARALRNAEDVRRVAEALGVETGEGEAFFFQNRKGKIQRLLLNAAQREGIEAGSLAIIEHPLPHAIEFALVPREGAEAVLKIEARALRFYNRGPEAFLGGPVRRDPKPHDKSPAGHATTSGSDTAS